MRSVRTDRFKKAFDKLPKRVQEQARSAYRLFSEDPDHPRLHFKRVHASKPIYSVRCGLHYRALGVKDGDVMVWFWIGSHSDYDQLLRQGGRLV